MEYFELIWSDEVRDSFLEEKIFLAHAWIVDGVYQNGQKLKFPRDWQTERYSSMPRGGHANFGSFTYCQSPRVAGWLDAGRYCSLASGMQRMGDSHPIDWASTSLWAYRANMRDLARREFGREFDLRRFNASPAKVTLGNDVWVGQNVLFKGGVRVGDGAVIAAGSVVTKDVEPYAIVGGAPARLIRHRFPPDVIEDMLRVKWWQYSFVDFAGFDVENPVRFLHQVEDAQLPQFSPGRINIAESLERRELIQPPGA